MKKKREKLLLFVCVIVSLPALVMYGRFISDKIYEESTSHLWEIYSQVNKTFTSLVSRNWNLLTDWGEYIEYVIRNGEEERLGRYLESGQEKWKYTDFYFLGEDGSYLTLTGEQGKLDLGSGLQRLTEGRENMIAGETLPGGEELTLFAVPVARNTYENFTYSAIAISYNNEDLESVLNVSAFSGSSDCFVIYPDGSLLFSEMPWNEAADNYLDYLGEKSDISEDKEKKLRSDMKNGISGILQCRINGEEYYVIYQPMGFENWMMIGAVPQNVVNAKMNQVQWVTVAVLTALFGFIAVSGLAVIVHKSREKLQDKELELKYRDQLFDILADNSADIFILFSTDDFHVEYISPNVERVLGFSREEIQADIGVLMRSSVIQGENLTREELKRIPMGDTYRTEHERIHQKNGERRWYQEILYRMNIENTDKFVLVLSDRTEEKAGRIRLEQALAVAEGANEAKSNFLSNMSHDIRTPLNAIVGFLTLLERDAERPEKVREYTRKISASSRHLLELINDVLDMSKIESGKTSLHIEAFSLKELIGNLDMVIRPQAAAKEQDFEIRTEHMTADCVMGDRLRINQILLNLLSNAVKYTQSRGTIRLSVSSQEGIARGCVQLRFQVEDNGIGMSPEFQKTVFESFSRERNSTTSKIQGTGLGMAIAKSLAELMGGTITVESARGRGSTFCVEMVLRVAEGEDAALVLAEKKGAFQENEDTVQENKDTFSGNEILKDKKFLVAEDNEINAEILQELLLMEGASCDVATNGEEAVELFAKSSEGAYDAVLMDIQMPVMNGYDAARAIRSCSHPEAERIPIVAMTANAFAEDVQNALAAGMNAHISKPVDMDALREFMEKQESAEGKWKEQENRKA